MDAIIVTDLESFQTPKTGFLHELTNAFNARGIHCFIASYDGEEYHWVRETSQHNVGVVVADMSCLTGITPLNALAETVENIPLLAVSSGAVITDPQEEALDAGATSFLGKDHGVHAIVENALRIAADDSPAPQ